MYSQTKRKAKNRETGVVSPTNSFRPGVQPLGASGKRLTHHSIGATLLPSSGKGRKGYEMSPKLN
jgi:hypothetical protein